MGNTESLLYSWGPHRVLLSFTGTWWHVRYEGVISKGESVTKWLGRWTSKIDVEDSDAGASYCKNILWIFKLDKLHSMILQKIDRNDDLGVIEVVEIHSIYDLSIGQCE